MALQLHRVIPNAGDGEVHVGGAGVVHLPDDWAEGPGLADLVTGLEEGVTSQVAASRTHSCTPQRETAPKSSAPPTGC